VCQRIRVCFWFAPFWFRGPLFLCGLRLLWWRSRLLSSVGCAWRGAVGSPCLRCLGFVMSFASFVSSLPVVGAVSSVVSAPAPVCPLASGAGVPSSVVVAGRSVSSSRFVPAASGVVSAVSAADPRGVVCVVGGRSFRCLWSALGGAGSPAALSLVAALRAARGSGVAVDLWCAPGRSGLPCPGYFCAVSV
jgi:hypothetical protein